MACKISKGVAYIITLYTITSLVYTLYVYCKDNIYIDMQAGRNLLPKLLVADN